MSTLWQCKTAHNIGGRIWGALYRNPIGVLPYYDKGEALSRVTVKKNIWSSLWDRNKKIWRVQ